MSDLSSLLTNASIQQQSTSVFGSSVQNFNNQQSLSQLYDASGSNGIFSSGASSPTGIPSGVSTANTSGNGVWNSIRYAADLVKFQPKFRFLFKVKFIFNDPYSSQFNREFMYVIKEIDKPKVTFEYEDVNMYNFKTRILKSIKHEPLNMVFHDDIQNKVSDFFNAYRTAYSPVSSLSYSQSSLFETSGMSFTTPGTTGTYSASMGLLAGGNKNILNYIEVVQVYANGSRMNTFIFSNPKIESFDFDNLTHESSEGNSLACSFSYDALYMMDSPTSGTPLYAWGQSDIIGNAESVGRTPFSYTLMGADNTSSSSSQPFLTSSPSSWMPQLTPGVVSSATSELDMAGATISSATPMIDQSTSGISNPFTIPPTSGQAAQINSLETYTPSSPNVFTMDTSV